MNGFEDILALTYFSNSVQAYLIALGILVGTLILVKLFKQIILTRIEKWAKQTKTDVDDELVKLIEDIPHIFYTYIAFYAGLQSLTVHSTISKVADVILIVLIVLIVLIFSLVVACWSRGLRNDYEEYLKDENNWISGTTYWKNRGKNL